MQATGQYSFIHFNGAGSLAISTIATNDAVVADQAESVRQTVGRTGELGSIFSHAIEEGWEWVKGMVSVNSSNTPQRRSR